MSAAADGFEGFDSSVFRAWAMGLADVLANCNASGCDPASIRAAGGVIYQFVKVADDLEAEERAAMRQEKAA